MIRLLRTTLAGGALFLLPLVLLVVLLDRALDLARQVLGPLFKLAGLDRAPTILGIGAATLVAIVALLAVSLAAGLFARTAIGRNASRRLEDTMFGSLPQYRMAKSLVQGWSDSSAGSDLTPVLVRADSGWQLGYRVEDLGDGWVTVFLPQAPGFVGTWQAGCVLALGLFGVSREVAIGYSLLSWLVQMGTNIGVAGFFLAREDISLAQLLRVAERGTEA